jgi:DNA-binding CsgD family transcriptional regulator
MQAVLRRRRLRSRRAVGPSFAEGQKSVARQALDQLAAGVIITATGAEVIEMNRAGEAIVQLEDGLLIRNDQLCARRVFETAKMGKLITGATADSKTSTAAGRMLIGRCDGLLADVLTVAPLLSYLAANDRRLAMIVVVDPYRHSPSERDLADLYGFSPAEARLAAALLSGKTLSETAADSGIRIPTLRTQLSSVLRKVGAERQSDLVRILSSTGIGSVTLAAGWLDIGLAVVQLPL